MSLEALRCQGCGAPLKGYKCGYCGLQYVERKTNVPEVVLEEKSPAYLAIEAMVTGRSRREYVQTNYSIASAVRDVLIANPPSFWQILRKHKGRLNEDEDE